MKYSYTNDNGKIVRGSAAMLHLIYTVCGGVGNFLKIFGGSAKKAAPKVKKNAPKIIQLFRKAS